ncbi:MAG: carotenoid oxygenase family protein [Kastovskya adunca ATA6-11-RM4]|jgi:carotenoid cleavage dioxygenase-like enzyme|nr:carotenoid oxygenase family protein [Kastovskya adunca ATA6-11-RM4]
MTTATKPSTRYAWAKAIAQPAAEFPPTPLPVLSGKIPEGLRGSLYRNGPGRLQRGGEGVGHWFDGDGAILGVHFTDAGATGIYRYVKTSGYKDEEAASKYLYPNYGMTARRAFWENWIKSVKNSANTSVLVLPDKLLALWEGGNPHALDLETLETWGLDQLGQLEKGSPYSAHYKRDPQTGEIFNFGIAPGLNSTIEIYKSDRTGQIIQQGSVTLDGVPIVHDFVLAGQYLVFFIPPVRLNLLLAGLSLRSFGEALEWQPDKATQIIVLDRETLSMVSRSEAEGWFQWHFSNGYVDADGSVVIDFIRYKDFQTNQYLKEVPTGETHTFAKGTLWQARINPLTGRVTKLEELIDRPCEFPVVPFQYVGQVSPDTYLAVHRDGVDIRKEPFNAIARYNQATDTLTMADMGENCYPSEALHAPDALNPDRSWVLTVVYDGNSDESEVRIYDNDALDDEPVCRLGLPSVIPHSFHGKWTP